MYMLSDMLQLVEDNCELNIFMKENHIW